MSGFVRVCANSYNMCASSYECEREFVRVLANSYKYERIRTSVSDNSYKYARMCDECAAYYYSNRYYQQVAMSLLLYKSINSRTRRYKLMYSVYVMVLYIIHIVRRMSYVVRCWLLAYASYLLTIAFTDSHSHSHSLTTAPTCVFAHSCTRTHKHNPCITSMLDIYILEHI